MFRDSTENHNTLCFFSTGQEELLLNTKVISTENYEIFLETNNKGSSNKSNQMSRTQPLDQQKILSNPLLKCKWYQSIELSERSRSFTRRYWFPLSSRSTEGSRKEQRRDSCRPVTRRAGSIPVFIDILEKSRETREEEEVSYATFGPPQPLIRRP